MRGYINKVEDKHGGAFPVLSSSASRNIVSPKSPKEYESTFPSATITDDNNNKRRSSTSGSRFACAFNALKCSSRAADEIDKFAVAHHHGSFPSLEDDHHLMAPEWHAEFEEESGDSSSEEEEGGGGVRRQPGSFPIGLDVDDSSLDSDKEQNITANTEQSSLELNSPLRIGCLNDGDSLDSDKEQDNTASTEQSSVELNSNESDSPARNHPFKSNDDAETETLFAKNRNNDGSSTSNVIPYSDIHPILSNDTNDTPQASNTNPKRESKPQSILHLGELDHVVSVFHSAGSLGDSITPMDSPVFEDNSDSGAGGPPAPAIDADEVKKILRMPYTTKPHLDHKTSSASEVSAGASSNNTTPYFRRPSAVGSVADSKSSLLFGEQVSIATESQNDREDIQIVYATGYDMTNHAGNNNVPEKYAGQPLTSLLNTDIPARGVRIRSASSVSSVSSFHYLEGAEERALRQLQNYRIDDSTNELDSTALSNNNSTPPRPFFWRSHPNMTSTSHDFQQQPNSRQQPRNKQQITPPHKIKTVVGDVGAKQQHSTSRRRGRSNNTNQSPPSYAQYIHPDLVQKVSQNPIVQSLASFARMQVSAFNGDRPGNKSR